MNLYKLTTQALTTYSGHSWKLGEWQDQGLGEMCSTGGFHAYTSPLLAAFLNPIHAKIAAPRLFRCEWRGGMLDNDHGLKVKVSGLRLVEELPMPEITLEQRVRFGILCVLEVYDGQNFREWARRWLSGEDRSKGAAWAAWATRAEAAAEAREAAWAAEAAAEAAWAAWAAEAAAEAARAAAVAAMASSQKPLDLIAIAERAMG